MARWRPPTTAPWWCLRPSRRRWARPWTRRCAACAPLWPSTATALRRCATCRAPAPSPSSRPPPATTPSSSFPLPRVFTPPPPRARRPCLRGPPRRCRRTRCAARGPTRAPCASMAATPRSRARCPLRPRRPRAWAARWPPWPPSPRPPPPPRPTCAASWWWATTAAGGKGRGWRTPRGAWRFPTSRARARRRPFTHPRPPSPRAPPPCLACTQMARARAWCGRPRAPRACLR
jgi:hypothetical protein